MPAVVHPTPPTRRYRIPAHLTPCLLALILVLASTRSAASADANWPGWRGDGSGISGETNLPFHWSASTGVAWKTPLPGEGNSSPVIWGERIFLTASTDAGTNRLVLCLDRSDGHTVWQTSLPAARTPTTYIKNGYASPTPVTDGERVYAFFDSPGLVALDMNGKTLWTRDLGPFKNIYNMASSPVLCGDRIIQCCDQDEGSFIVALDKTTGDERWRTPRPGMLSQFATPLVITVAGKPQIVANGQTVIAYDPADGREIWTCRGMRPNVTPSAVAAGDLVYAASGRNGPALAIDPRGAGDVTETQVRMQVSSGGPYVPSPLALAAGLLLPGDDGRIQLIGVDGKIRCSLRIPGHYTASPVAGGDILYWANEKGQVAVVRLAGAPQQPTLTCVAVNDVGGACMASPAITGGKLLIRTDQALLCIDGTATPAPAEAAELPATFADLNQLFADHPAPEGTDVALRIAIVEKLGTLKDADSVRILQHAALKDPHWDVGEAAAKSLAGIGQPAIPALVSLMGAVDWQPYLKTIAADALGQLAAVEGVAVLLKASRDRNLLVRLPALQALGQIAAKHPAETGTILPVLLAAIEDREGSVRKVAFDALALNANAFMTRDAPLDLKTVSQKLKAAAGDPNPLVEQAAGRALLRFAKAALRTPAAPLQDRPGDAEQPEVPVMHWLQAGPVRMKFQDGELRYLSVAGREIIRRIYFAVRDARYDTVMPAFSEVSVTAAADAFTIRLAAVCTNDLAGFSWYGTITGTADGTITFFVKGQADRDFKPPRIGLNVLYGTDALAGHAYELFDKTGASTSAEFPRQVAATRLSNSFRTLRYTTDEGLKVRVELAEGTFGMEDQRNFGDSSYKAFSGMPFAYMNIKKGEAGTQTLTIAVTGAPTNADTAATPLRITLGGTLPGARLPQIVATNATRVDFGGINGTPDLHTAAPELVWGFNVALHLPDDDTFMENIPAIADQVKTVRTWAPQAKTRIDPVTFRSPYPRPSPDPRFQSPFGSAWVVRMMKHLGCAGVEKAAFDVGDATAAALVEELAHYAGSPLLTTVREGGGIPDTVDVLAIDTAGQRRIWVVNLTDQPGTVILAGLGTGAAVEIRHGPASDVEQTPMTATGDITLHLGPFEVCRLLVQLEDRAGTK